jgi:hypothetical protein
MRFKGAVRGSAAVGEGKGSLPRGGDGKPQSPRSGQSRYVVRQGLHHDVQLKRTEAYQRCREVYEVYLPWLRR